MSEEKDFEPLIRKSRELEKSVQQFGGSPPTVGDKDILTPDELERQKEALNKTYPDCTKIQNTVEQNKCFIEKLKLGLQRPNVTPPQIQAIQRIIKSLEQENYYTSLNEEINRMKTLINY